MHNGHQEEGKDAEQEPTKAGEIEGRLRIRRAEEDRVNKEGEIGNRKQARKAPVGPRYRRKRRQYSNNTTASEWFSRQPRNLMTLGTWVRISVASHELGYFLTICPNDVENDNFMCIRKIHVYAKNPLRG